MISKFVGTFRELASFSELLNTQVELILVERVHRNWLKVLVTLAVYTSCAHVHCAPALCRTNEVCMQAIYKPQLKLSCTSLWSCASLPILV